MKGRLGPGMMIAADLVNGQVGTWPIQILLTLFEHILTVSLADINPTKLQVYENTEVKKRVSSLNPYGKWIKENLRFLKPVNFKSSTVMENEEILRTQQ